jgi:hypothetical protein
LAHGQTGKTSGCGQGRRRQCRVIDRGRFNVAGFGYIRPARPRQPTGPTTVTDVLPPYWSLGACVIKRGTQLCPTLVRSATIDLQLSNGAGSARPFTSPPTYILATSATGLAICKIKTSSVSSSSSPSTSPRERRPPELQRTLEADFAGAVMRSVLLKLRPPIGSACSEPRQPFVRLFVNSCACRLQEHAEIQSFGSRATAEQRPSV